MPFQTIHIHPHIKLSAYTGKPFKTEVLFEQHMLVWFMAGQTKIIQAKGTYMFKGGDVFLIPRHQLATVINYPQHDQPHKAVAMHLTRQSLKDFYAKHKPISKGRSLKKIYSFKRHPLLQSCLASLMPYFELAQELPQEIAELKIQEAISILRNIDASVDGLLADFEEPGKINLADFMEHNYMFNMPLNKFSYLTGRSLATFRRDFKKLYNTTPQKWLTQKRLQLAHYQIAQQQRRPNEVYLEAGFENLSHFSYAFKNHFGYTPNALLQG